ncbi:hypothetical protein NL676_000931 [Syzygium grande]|nr:hypothetical protein NL676_000931 [Syzygium grande]
MSFGPDRRDAVSKPNFVSKPEHDPESAEPRRTVAESFSLFGRKSLPSLQILLLLLRLPRRRRSPSPDRPPNRPRVPSQPRRAVAAPI